MRTFTERPALFWWRFAHRYADLLLSLKFFVIKLILAFLSPQPMILRALFESWIVLIQPTTHMYWYVFQYHANPGFALCSLNPWRMRSKDGCKKPYNPLFFHRPRYLLRGRTVLHGDMYLFIGHNSSFHMILFISHWRGGIVARVELMLIFVCVDEQMVASWITNIKMNTKGLQTKMTQKIVGTGKQSNLSIMYSLAVFEKFEKVKSTLVWWHLLNQNTIFREWLLSDYYLVLIWVFLTLWTGSKLHVIFKSRFFHVSPFSFEESVSLHQILTIGILQLVIFSDHVPSSW